MIARVPDEDDEQRRAVTTRNARSPRIAPARSAAARAPRAPRQREDADADRERAGGPEPVVEDPVLPEAPSSSPTPRSRCRSRPRTDRRAPRASSTAPTQSQRDQVERQRAHPLATASRAPATETPSTRNSDERAASGSSDASTQPRERRATDRHGRLRDSAHDQPERERRRPGTQTAPRRGSARTRARARRSRDRGEDRPRAARRRAGEPVRREDRGRHDEHLHVLDRRERGLDDVRSTRPARSARGRAS